MRKLFRNSVTSSTDCGATTKVCLGCGRTLQDCTDAVKETLDAGSMPSCPQSRTYCSVDGSCRFGQDEGDAGCPNTECAAGTPFRCANGRCVTDVTRCESTETGCKDGYERCGDGTCAKIGTDGSTCPASVSCASGATLCKDGSCRLSCPSDLTANGCSSATPHRCAGTNGECVEFPELCTHSGVEPDGKACPKESPIFCAKPKGCITVAALKAGECGHPSVNPGRFCPVGTPVRCPGGLCAMSTLDCSSISNGENSCPSDAPYLCADGSCAESESQCQVIRPCGSGEHRCADGSCRSSELQCPIGAEQPGKPGSTTFCPAEMPFRCYSGICATSPSMCTSNSTSSYDGCPMSHPVKCTQTGKCVTSQSQCVTIPSNGCPANLPHKCWDGGCQMNATGCTAVTGCPLTSPIRCGNGSCSALSNSCNNVTSCADVSGGLTPVRCSNGECVATSASCKAKNGCPLTAPSRCFNGTCVSDLNECPSSVVCDGDFPILCADGKCVGDPRHCPAVHPCPNGQKLCNDLKCGTATQCADRMKHCPAVGLCRRRGIVVCSWLARL